MLKQQRQLLDLDFQEYYAINITSSDRKAPVIKPYREVNAKWL